MAEPPNNPPRGIAGLLPVAVLAAVAVLVGIVVRFKGLGTWSFAADEYFLAKSVENVLRAGLPEYLCGGYYTRGLLHQYLAAGLQLLGASPELAVRAVAAATSLLALPAAYLLGRRVYGSVAGLLLVALVAVSVWEVEMARFGRMYAPFQALFLWYLLFFLRYTVDRQARALWGMVILSATSVLVWEGGVLLGLANLLPPFFNHDNGRLRAPHWRYLGAMALLFLPIYWFVTHDFRFIGDVPALPPDYAAVVAAALPDGGPGMLPLFLSLTAHPGWMAAGLLPLAAAALALPWIAAQRRRWLTAAGLLVSLVAALLHLFLVVTAVLGLLLLFRLLRWKDLSARPAWPFLAAILIAGVYWLAAGLATDTWRGAEPLPVPALLAALAYQLFGFPDFLDMVLRQLGRAAPVLGLSLALLLGLAAIGQVRAAAGDAPGGSADAGPRTDERVLLVFIVVMLLLVGIADSPRQETRYFFFLYPVLLLVGIGVLLRLVQAGAGRLRYAGLVAAAAVLGWFCLTEDFSPYHLRNIDTAEVNFREHLPYKVRGHYIRRTDRQAVAAWLFANAEPERDLVISGNGASAVDSYYPHFDFFYVDPRDARLSEWSCTAGTVERWSNLPLVYSSDDLRARILSSSRSFMVIDGRRLDAVMAAVGDLGADVAWENRNGFEVIIRFQAAPSAARPE